MKIFLQNVYRSQYANHQLKMIPILICMVISISKWIMKLVTIRMMTLSSQIARRDLTVLIRFWTFIRLLILKKLIYQRVKQKLFKPSKQSSMNLLLHCQNYLSGSVMRTQRLINVSYIYIIYAVHLYFVRNSSKFFVQYFF